MLIETQSPVKNNDVVSVKLLGGDEVVGRFVETDSGKEYLTLSKPMLIMMGQQGFGLGPFVMTASPDLAKIDIKQSAVVAMVKTYEPVAKEYLKQTTGIIT